MEVKDKKRNEYLDSARGLAAIFVVWGHTLFYIGMWFLPERFKSLGLLYEVPAFFVIAGWAASFNDIRIKNALISVIKLFLKWTFFVLFLSFFCYLTVFTPHPLEGVSDFSDLIKNIFMKVSFPSLPVVQGSIWFLPLFMAVLVLNTLILSLLKNNKYKDLIYTSYLFILILLSFLFTYFLEAPEFIKSVLFYSAFYMIGFLRKYFNKIDDLKKLIISIIILFSLYIIFTLLKGYPLFMLQEAKFPPTIIYFASSGIGILILFYLEKKIKKNSKLLSHIGKNSIFYYFSQGVSTSLLSKTNKYFPYGNYFIRIIIYFVLALFLTIIIAEPLAFIYKKLEGLLKSLPKNIINYIVILIIGIILFFSTGKKEPYLMGEWDDYSLPVASILNDKNFTIGEDDILFYKRVFPQWSEKIDAFKISESLSGYRDKNGDYLTWYFPTYSAASIPAVLFLRLIGRARIYAFSLTNIGLLLLSLIILNRFLKADDNKKLLLILTLSIHPAVFYINYIGAEVFIYSLMIETFVFWHNKNYKAAAFFNAVAGTMNATVLSVGLFMIFDFFDQMLKEKKKDESIILFLKKNIIRIISYGAVYIIGLIPMIYNLILTGHINLTASYDKFTKASENTFERAYSYLFDMNYGMLPYFPVIIWLAALFLLLSIIKKNYKAFLWLLSGLTLVLSYSVMIHINSGMDAIARYNVWGSVPFIFSVLICYEDILNFNIKLKKIVKYTLCFDIIISALMIQWYGINRAENTAYIFMNPLPVKVLENAPSLYNPLHSTFASRTLYKDGCYEYDTPVVYKSYEDNTVRKVLATEDDKAFLLENYHSASGENKWWEKKVNSLKKRETYISVPKKYMIEENLYDGE